MAKLKRLRAAALCLLLFSIFYLSLLSLEIPEVKAASDPVEFSTNQLFSGSSAPLDSHTFILAYLDVTADQWCFQIFDTNGTQILAEQQFGYDVGTPVYGTHCGVAVLDASTFIIGFFNYTARAIMFRIFDVSGSELISPVVVDDNAGIDGWCVSVSAFNSTTFVIGWADYADQDITFSVYDSGGNLLSGPVDADESMGSVIFNSVSVSCFNSTTFVIGWYDGGDADATFSVYDAAGNLITGPVDADDAVQSSGSVSVAAFNSEYFVIGWYDRIDYDATFSVYDAAGNLITGPVDADISAGTNSYSVKVAALNNTAFVISWYDTIDNDLSFSTRLMDNTVLAGQTDIEDWPSTSNNAFRCQSPCSYTPANGIGLAGSNWIIAYSNTTTQGIWRSYTPEGAVWDGIVDLTAPACSNVAASTNFGNAECEFSAYWEDDSDLDSFIFGTNNTGSWVNETESAFGGNPDWSNITKTLGSGVGDTVQWQIWAWDSAGNIGTTGLQSFALIGKTVSFYIDTAGCSLLVDDSPAANGSSAVYVYGQEINITAVPASNYILLNFTWGSGSTEENPLLYLVNDTDAEEIWSYFAYEPYPQFSIVGFSTNKYGQDAEFYSYWEDLVAMDGGFFGCNVTGSWENQTWASSNHWINHTITLTAKLDIIEYQFWGNNTTGNWNTTGLLQMVIHGYNVTFNIGADGQLDINGTLYAGDQSWLDQDFNTIFSLQAYPNGGKSFSGYTVNGEAVVLNPTSLSLDEDKTVVCSWGSGGGAYILAAAAVAILILIPGTILLFVLLRRRR